VDIATGNTLLKFNTGTGADTVFGLSVKGEITVSGKPTAAVAVSPPPVTVKGAPGQTVDLGTFTLTNTSSLTETFTTLTINLSHPSVLSSLSLSGTFDEGSTTTAATNSPKGSNVLTLTTPVVLLGGGVATFTAQGKIGSAPLAALTGVSGVAMAAVANSESLLSGTSNRSDRSNRMTSGFGLALVAGIFLLATLLKLRLPMRSAMFALLAFLMIGSMSCDPCASCGGGGVTSATTTVTIETATGTDQSSTAVTVTGVPAPLNTVTQT
jgi:hypothetical protein